MKGRIGKLNPYDVPRDERGSSLNPVRDSRTRLNHETLFFFYPPPTHSVFLGCFSCVFDGIKVFMCQDSTDPREMKNREMRGGERATRSER